MELTNSSGGFDPWRAPETAGGPPTGSPDPAPSTTTDWSRFDPSQPAQPMTEFQPEMAASEVNSTDIAALAAQQDAVAESAKKARRKGGKLPWFLVGLLTLAGIGVAIGWSRSHSDATKTHKLATELQTNLASEKRTTTKLTTDLKETTDQLDSTTEELDSTKKDLNDTQGQLSTANQQVSDLKGQLEKAPDAASREQLVSFAQQITTDFQQLATLTPDQLQGVISGLDARHSELLALNTGSDDAACKTAIGISGFNAYQLAAVSLYNLAVTKSPAYLGLVNDVQNRAAEVDTALRSACGF